MKKNFFFILAAISFVSLFLYSEPEEKVPAPLPSEDDAPADHSKKICLNMIVKNEKAVIERCLATVKPLIDYWVIVDTGSTDGTQSIIKEYMKDIPGELHEKPWINFGHNRNEALLLAKKKAEYSLFIDADEVLEFEKDFKLPKLEKDFYFIKTSFAGTQYCRVQLIKNALNWKWEGVLHEAVDCPEAKSNAIIEKVKNVVRTDGARSQDPQKFQKDAQILEEALKNDPFNRRNVFYLAQSYKDAQNHSMALLNYQKRAGMGGWDQEIFWSLYQIARLFEILEMPEEVIIKGYERAFKYRPSRIEPLHFLIQYHRNNDNFEAGYQAAYPYLNKALSNDALFVEKWVYDYGLLLEFSICAYWTERYSEALLATQLLLTRPNLPENVITCLNHNLKWINVKLAELQLEKLKKEKKIKNEELREAA
ncbi:MAG: glycosyltransferase [Candidatus Protochlamydia sp.]|nr:glycosyltransferase [Candidatus Protochlamydia sp.]